MRKETWYLNTGPPKRLRDWKIHDRARDHVYRLGMLYLTPGDPIPARC